MTDRNNDRGNGETASEAKIQDPVTYAVIGAAQKVHRTLGPGFVEATYHNALMKELTMQEVPFDSQREFDVYYEGTRCGTYRPDLVIENRVIVELKAVADICKEHRMQTISYLKASSLPTALLINFGAPSLEFRRLANTSAPPMNQPQSPESQKSP